VGIEPRVGELIHKIPANAVHRSAIARPTTGATTAAESTTSEASSETNTGTAARSTSSTKRTPCTTARTAGASAGTARTAAKAVHPSTEAPAAPAKSSFARRLTHAASQQK
jgi:hypothetical protein